MQNFIFISPNFPTNYWQFCRELKNNGLNVLGIGDQPYEEITNNDMTDGPTCIVVKESFGNCFIPFLVNHYSKVYVIDYRHYTAGTVTQLAQQVGADDVLCLNNISMTRNEGLVNQFSNIF